MGMEPPVLEYARAERVGGDRYRRWFLLAGVPGVVLLLLPIGGRPPVVAEVFKLAWSLHTPSVLVRLVSAVVDSPEWRIGIARDVIMMTPVSLLAWHLLRLGRREPGRMVGGIGLGVALIHAAGLAGILVALAQAVPWQVPLAGSALLVCGVLSGVAWRRLGWGAFVLLALLSGYIGFSALMIVQKLMHLNAVRGWPWLWLIVAMVSAVGGGIEFAHVFRSGRGEPHA